MSRNKISLKKITFFLLAVSLSFNLTFPPFALAQLQNVIDSDKEKDVFLYTGDLVTVKVKSLTKVAVANPGVVDITNASADELTLVGRKVGETQVFIWDETGKKQILARVVSTDLNLTANRIASLIQSAGIKGVSFEKNYAEGKILISGSLSKNEKKKLDETIKGFTNDVINLVTEEGELIQIDVQFSELDTTLTKVLGIDWSTGTTLAFSFEETLPTQDGSFGDLFKIGDFSRTSAILSVVNLIISEGKGRILSKPSLVVTNGEQASFLVGGEIPITSTTSSNGGTSVQESVTYKEYGVQLTVTPELRDGKIDIEVNITVRTIDDSNAVGDNVAYLTRTATTKVRLLDAQTIVLAGMINRRQGETVSRVPFLSKIPIVGLLFQNKSMPNQEQELVVSLTPRILKDLPIAKKKAQKSSKPKTDENQPKKDIAKEVSSQGNKTDVKRVEPAVVKSQEVKPVDQGKAQPVVKSENKEPQKDVKKSPEQLKAEKKAADKKAREEAEKLKKQKAQQAKRDKQAKALAQKNAKKTGKEKVSKPIAERKDAKEIVGSNSGNLKSLDDPSLNMALDDPRFTDPKNVLSDEEISAIKGKYSNKIKEQMSATISYPYEAKESGWEGTVTLNVTILPDGSVKNVSVNKSSGYAIFDKDAVNTAEILSPYDRFVPAKNLREVVVPVEVEYSENAILGTNNLQKK